MTIHNLGYHFQHPSNFKIHRPHGSGDYVLLVLPTKSFFILGQETIYAEANSLMIYRKGTPQFFGATDEIFINHWIHFDLTEEEEASLNAMKIPFDRPISCGDITAFAQIIKHMYMENIRSIHARKIPCCCILIFCGSKLRSVSKLPPPTDPIPTTIKCPASAHIFTEIPPKIEPLTLFPRR